MTDKLNVSIVGGSGYVGGELLRLLLFHPHVTVQQITSVSQVGKFAHTAHPNLRSATDIRSILLIGADWRIPATFIAVAIALMITGYTSSRLAGSPTGRAVARNVVGGALAMGVPTRACAPPRAAAPQARA